MGRFDESSNEKNKICTDYCKELGLVLTKEMYEHEIRPYPTLTEAINNDRYGSNAVVNILDSLNHTPYDECHFMKNL